MCAHGNEDTQERLSTVQTASVVGKDMAVSFLSETAKETKGR